MIENQFLIGTNKLGIVIWTMLRIICDDLGLHTHKCYTYHVLTEKLKEIQHVCSQNLLDEYDGKSYCDILFAGEKKFSNRRVFL